MGGGDLRLDRHRRHDHRAGRALFRQREPEGTGRSQRTHHDQPTSQRRAYQPDAFAKPQDDALADPQKDSLAKNFSMRGTDWFFLILSSGAGLAGVPPDMTLYLSLPPVAWRN